MKSLTIGQVARCSDTGIETVRFYEREGLLNRPARSASGYRLFGDEVIARLRFIQRAKELGFTLHEIRELLSLRVDPGMSCQDVRAKAQLKIAGIESRIKTLVKMKKALARLSRACSENGRRSDCPLLDVLDGHTLQSNEGPGVSSAAVRRGGKSSKSSTKGTRR
jgi:MerR family mercuric resistance operon transcriptional regulator